MKVAAVLGLIVRRFAVIAALVAVGGFLIGSCASWQAECQGDPTKLPCTCGGQRNPGCYSPLNDDPVIMDAKRPDGGSK